MRMPRFTVLAAGIAVVAAGALAGTTPAAAAAPAVRTATATPAIPPVPLVPHANLRGVAIVSGHRAWAVGDVTSGDGASTRIKPLIMQWNGSTWAAVPGPAVAGGTLASVAVTASDDAWAVGTLFNPNGNCPCRALIEHWDGAAWKLMASPHPLNRSLSAVTAVSARNVWAVGTIDPHPSGNCPCFSLIEHWNGTAWKQMHSPRPERSSLNGITAVSARNIWAVGAFNPHPSRNCGCRALIEHWNGTAWQEVPAPAEDDATFLGVTARSARDAWAVGQDGSRDERPLIEHWNGTSWQRLASPGGKGTQLSAVAAGSARSAWAAGVSINGFPRLEHWDGTAWTLVRPHRSHPRDIFYSALAASSARYAWAVGSFSSDAAGDSGLILHWDGTAWR